MTKKPKKLTRPNPPVWPIPKEWRHPQRHTAFKRSCANLLTDHGCPTLPMARSYVSGGYGFDLQHWVWHLGGWELTVLVPEATSHD